MIGETFNYDDIFLRDLTVCVLDTLEKKVKWLNRFTSGDVLVEVPFYYSLTGNSRFLFDSFTDDVVSNNRKSDVNTDIVPRGHITLTSWNIKSDEFANPNVWLKMVVENQEEMRKELKRIRALPISAKYDMEILVRNEIDAFKCSQSIMNLLWVYKYMYFEYNFMHIDALMSIPDDVSVEINRQVDLTTDNNIRVKISFEVDTYYPAMITDGKDDHILKVLDVNEQNPKRVTWLEKLRADAVTKNIS
jgi:hypothetical protein